MSLIEEAQKELIIVSPYVNVDYWGKMKSCLERAIERGVIVTLIVRKNADHKGYLSYFENLKLNLILIDNLHAKLYMNDKYAIVTSQNLLQSSDNNSIEIGYITTNNLERKELVTFVNQFIFKINPIENNVNLVETEKNFKIPITEVEKFETKVVFKEWQVEKAFMIFKEQFPNVNFKQTSSYIFSRGLLPFADVMIYNRLVIKYSKHLLNSDLIANKIGALEFRLNNDFKVEYLARNNSYFYYEFVPQGYFSFYNLIEDYTLIINQIIKSGIGVELQKEKYKFI